MWHPIRTSVSRFNYRGCSQFITFGLGVLLGGSVMTINTTWVGVIVIVIGFTIYFFNWIRPDKDELPSIDDAAKHSKTIWGLWFTGDRQLKLIKRYNNFQRILLVKPNSLAFRELLEIRDDKEKIMEEIKTLTQQAIKQGVKVRWYSESQTDSLTIYDPMQNDEPVSKKAYYVISRLEKGVPRRKRGVSIQKKRDDENDFKYQFNRYKKLWETSSEPKPEEYSE